MNEEEKNIRQEGEDKPGKEVSQGRRDTLKALVAVPVLGAMAYGVYQKKKKELTNRDAAEMFRMKSDVAPYSPTVSDAAIIRLGIIGYGIRGTQLMQALGFATPEYVETQKDLSKTGSTRYQDFLEQEDLRVEITAVCDIFDPYAADAIRAGSNIYREGVNGKYGEIGRASCRERV